MTIQTVNLGTAPSGAGGDTFRSTGAKINENFTNPSHAASRYVGVNAGNVMEVGAFGLGTTSTGRGTNSLTGDQLITGFYSNIFTDRPNTMPNWGTALHISNASGGDVHFTQLLMDIRSPNLYYRSRQDASYTAWAKIYNTANTTVDSNGVIKAASPIVRLFTDKIELNDEAAQQKITFVKNGVGDYLIKGSSGFAQDGWYIETPKDANGNLLVAVVYEQLENGDISVKTYDYMLNKKGRIVADTETPLDIPEARWIDIRLQELPQPESEVTDDPEQ